MSSEKSGGKLIGSCLFTHAHTSGAKPHQTCSHILEVHCVSGAVWVLGRACRRQGTMLKYAAQVSVLFTTPFIKIYPQYQKMKNRKRLEHKIQARRQKCKAGYSQFCNARMMETRQATRQAQPTPSLGSIWLSDSPDCSLGAWSGTLWTGAFKHLRSHKRLHIVLSGERPTYTECLKGLVGLHSEVHAVIFTLNYT